MRRLADNLRRAARSLAKAPLFTSVAVISLALALALNTTMFALADAVLHPYNPYPQSERIVEPGFLGGDPKHALTFDVRFEAIRDGVHYDRIGEYKFLRNAVVQTSSTSEYHWAVGVSPEFFDVLGVRPMLGRVFNASNVAGRATQGAVISFRLWNRLFNARPLSETLTIDVGHSRYTVIGVMPRAVHHPWGMTDVWLPLDALPADPSVRAIGPLPILRLKPGTPVDAVRAELTVISARLTAEFTPKRPLSARVSVMGTEAPPQEVFPSFVLGTVAMVLLIACANLGTMMIARGMGRRRETAIRVALGASRRDVIGGVLTECAVVVVAGVTLGMLLTWWALYVLPHFTIPSVPALGDIQPAPSWRVFCFALVASLATILCAGALPAWRAARADPAESMKEGSATTTGRLRDRYNPLIVIEVALSTALLMCSGLFVVEAVRLAAFDFRYAAKQLVTADVEPRGKWFNGPAVARFWNETLERSEHVPHVRFAATRRWDAPEGRVIYGEQGKGGDRWMNSNGYAIVTPDYFRTMGISIVRGRDFVAGDAGAGTPVVIVDEQAAQRLWPDVANPIGRMIKLGRKEAVGPWLRVIGVAQAIEYLPRKDNYLPPEPVVYVTMPNDTAASRRLLVRGDGSTGVGAQALLAMAVQKELESALPTQGSVPVRPWLDEYESRRDATAFMASMFGSFAAFGLLLCAVGLYGVLAYTVTRRIREFAVRIALGARRRDVMRLVVHDAAVTALGGVGVGAFIALWLTRSIVENSPFVFAAAIALIGAECVLFAVAAVAALGPVRHAVRADPVEVLRAN